MPWSRSPSHPVEARVVVEWGEACGDFIGMGGCARFPYASLEFRAAGAPEPARRSVKDISPTDELGRGDRDEMRQEVAAAYRLSWSEDGHFLTAESRTMAWAVMLYASGEHTRVIRVTSPQTFVDLARCGGDDEGCNDGHVMDHAERLALDNGSVEAASALYYQARPRGVVPEIDGGVPAKAFTLSVFVVPRGPSGFDSSTLEKALLDWTTTGLNLKSVRVFPVAALPTSSGATRFWELVTRAQSEE